MFPTQILTDDLFTLDLVGMWWVDKEKTQKHISFLRLMAIFFFWELGDLN